VKVGTVTSMGRDVTKVATSKMRPCRKLPVTVHAVQMNYPFRVMTKEGPLDGKYGDFLMRGVEGELYPCDQQIWFKTYRWEPEAAPVSSVSGAHS